MNQQEIIYTLNSNQVLLIQMLCKGGSIDSDADKMSSLSYISWSSLYGVHSLQPAAGTMMGQSLAVRRR